MPRGIARCRSCAVSRQESPPQLCNQGHGLRIKVANLHNASSGCNETALDVKGIELAFFAFPYKRNERSAAGCNARDHWSVNVHKIN